MGGGCPGHRTPRPGGSPSPPPVCAGTNRARGGGPGAESRDRAGRLVARAAIRADRGPAVPRGVGSRSRHPPRRVTPTPPSPGYTTIPWGQDHPPAVTAARSPGRPGESCFGPLGQALAGQVRRARGRAVSRGADATHHPARRGRLGGLADRGPSCCAGDPFHAVLRIRSAAGPRRPEPSAPHAPPADWVVTPCRFGDTPHGGEPLIARRTSRRREPDRPGRQMWLRGPGGCGQRHGEGGRCPRPPRPGRPSGLPPRRGRRPSPRLRPGRRRRPRAHAGDPRGHRCLGVRSRARGPGRPSSTRIRSTLSACAAHRASRPRAPRLPVTHDALSECAFRAGDDAWRQHGDRALEILRHIKTSDRWTSPASCRGGPLLASRLEQQP